MRVKLLNMEKEFGCLIPVTSFRIFLRKKFHPTGLFSEQIFGPVEDYQCQCGRYHGREYANKVCEVCKVMITNSNLRLTNFAKISIPDGIKLINPILIEIFLKECLKIKSDVKINSIISGGVNVVIDEESERIVADKDNGESGPTFFRTKLYPYLIKTYPEVAAFDSVYGHLLYTSVVPVIPPDTRPISRSSSNANLFFTEETNKKYAEIINECFRIQESPFIHVKSEISLQLKFEKLIKCLLDKHGKKTGFVRGHMLGKRVDYSGRAVICPDTENMPLGYCKLPLRMARELFKPQILKPLANRLKISVITLFQEFDLPKYNDDIKRIIKEKFIGTFCLLNRQPTLHRLSMASSYIYDITDDDVITIHPLITNQFNADFDGDQMAVYLAQTIGYSDMEKMWVANNYREPSNGKINYLLKQDMVLGLNEISTRGSEIEYLGEKTLDSRVYVFKESVPAKYHTNLNIFKLFNKVLNKNNLADLSENLTHLITIHEWIKVIDRLCNIGFKNSKISISLSDFEIDRSIPFNPDTLPVNSATKMIRSGARGSWGNYSQTAYKKGFISDVTGTIFPEEITASLLDGLTPRQYYISSAGGRKGIIDSAENTAKSGYLTRKLVFLLSPMMLNTELYSCSIQNNNEKTFDLYVRDEKIASMLINRYTTDGQITKHNYKSIVGKRINLYSPITCNTPRVCRHCYGGLYEAHNSKMVGIIAAQSLGERTTQLTLRTKHTSGYTDNSLGELEEFVILKDGVLIAKKPGKVLSSNTGCIFIFNDDADNEIMFESYHTIKFKLEEREDGYMYFQEGYSIASVTFQNNDIVSAVSELSVLLNRPKDGVTAEEFLYSLVDIYGEYATMDLIHFELIVSKLSRDPSNKFLPSRLNAESDGYVMEGLSKILSLRPEKVLAFERFAQHLCKSIMGKGCYKDDIEDGDGFSILNSMMFFDFDYTTPPMLEYNKCFDEMVVKSDA